MWPRMSISSLATPSSFRGSHCPPSDAVRRNVFRTPCCPKWKSDKRRLPILDRITSMLISVPSSKDNGEQQTQYAAALNGSGLISMDSIIASRCCSWSDALWRMGQQPKFWGIGYSSGVYTLSPYIGLQVNSAKTQLVFQYQPTVTGYSSTVYSNQTMHVGCIHDSERRR